MKELEQKLRDLLESAKETALENKDDFSSGRYDGIKETLEVFLKFDRDTREREKNLRLLSGL